MADNTTINPGASGDIIATDDIAGAKYQRVKLIHGADGTNDGDVSTANPYPVQVNRISTATLSNVADSASSVTLLASNANRRGASFFNDSTETLYLKHGATASTTSFTVRLDPYDFYELPNPVYTGIVDGIWGANGSGSARMTEHT